MSRLGHGLRGATRRMSFQSSFKPSFSSNYTRFASASSFTQSTKSAPTMTMSYPQTMSAMTPSCMVFSSISLTPNMEQGSHLIGLGSTSSALSEEEEEDDAVCFLLYSISMYAVCYVPFVEYICTIFHRLIHQSNIQSIHHSSHRIALLSPNHMKQQAWIGMLE
eukprot:599344_1